MPKELKEIRAAIDQIDDQIIDLLAERFSFVKDVAAYKKANNLAAALPDRINEVLSRNAARASQKNINPDLIRQIYTAIIDEYCRLEEGYLHPNEQQKSGT